jgi:hypothetical protein
MYINQINKREETETTFREVLKNLIKTSLKDKINIIITMTITFITFVQGTYNYIREKNHVCTAYSVAAVLYLQYVLHVMFFSPV